MRLVAVLALLVPTLVPILAVAQQPAGSASAQVRRDPKGIVGISPLWEQVAKGDNLVMARDLEGAIGAYHNAIAQSPQSPLGHYRLAQAHSLKGDLKEAELAYTNALRFAEDDPALKAKLLFCLADLRQRQNAYPEALTRFVDYESHAAAHAKVATFPAASAERRRRIEAWQKLSAEAADVKARIEKRQKAGD